MGRPSRSRRTLAPVGIREEGCGANKEAWPVYASALSNSCARARDGGGVPRGGVWVDRAKYRDVHPVQLQTGTGSQGWAAGLLRLGAGPGPERAVVDGCHHSGGGDRTPMGVAVGLR